ncbi:TRAP transporter small permease [Plastorhodobacter daqingensis]|uniref:TRAP transporter small permease protein n=1 Tax=Plastorhodobacter daqingensis TaxID=1387281 RepID=A0ABW2UME4_9RHOB
MRFFSWTLVVLGRAELVAASLLVLAMICAVSVEVYYRYVLGSSLYWVEEGATIAFIWVTFLGAALASKANRHITITSLGGIFRAGRSRALWALGGQGAIVVVAAVIAYHSFGYTTLQARTATVSLPVNIPRSWMFAWPLCLGMVSIALTHLYYFMDNVISLFAPGVRPAPRPLLEI